MVFTSINYFIFLAIVFVLYHLINQEYKRYVLLFSSLFFYANFNLLFFPIFLLIGLATYFFAVQQSKKNGTEKEQRFFRIGIFLLSTPLLFFKYTKEIAVIFCDFIGLAYLEPQTSLSWIILPVGVSFYTFMAIGYLIDVKNEDIKPNKNLPTVLLFLSFFPLVLSGPIERAKNIFIQIESKNLVKYDDIAQGARTIIWGFFLKMVIAERLAIYIDSVFTNYTNYNGITLATASILYPFQIYTDLGGYSLIAIGSAKLFGIDIIQNFNRPFFATSMSDFWRRWHMSLITWLTDYIYTPISFQLRAKKQLGIIIALLLTFLISGLWHGATLPFIMWGILHGIYLSIEVLTSNFRKKIIRSFGSNKWVYLIIAQLIVFILFTISQIVARSENIDMAKIVLFKILTMSLETPFLDYTNLILGVFFLSIVLLKDFVLEYKFGYTQMMFVRNNKLVSSIFYSLLFYIIIMFGVAGSERFIYFQF
jgi:alginate O-acetyltransferase complex protein AlgI